MILREIELLGRQRRQETDKAPLGRKRILLQVPDYRPERVARSSAPAFHAVAKEHFRKLREMYWGFVEEYRKSAEELKVGVLRVVFPAGCFPPRLPYVPEVRAGP